MDHSEKNANEMALSVLSWIKDIQGNDVPLEKMIPSNLSGYCPQMSLMLQLMGKHGHGGYMDM